MFKYNFVHFFPELANIPKAVQQDIVEQARYETFTQVEGSNGKFVWHFIIVGILFVVGGGVIGYFSGAGSTIAGIFGGIGSCVAIYLQQRSWARQIHPKVRELAKRYIPPEK